jgi:integrase
MYPIVHAGSFRTLKEAKARRDFVAGELAGGRNPTEALRALSAAPAAVLTFSAWAKRYSASRVDLATETTKNLASHLKAMTAFDDRDPATITPADVQEWIAGLTLKPASIRRYLATLRAVLDFAGVDPNPARDGRVKLPREESTVVDPPSAADVDTIIATVPPRWRLALRTLAETGMRVGEAHALSWGDVDEAGSRFRIKAGKTAAARRWVAVPEALMLEVAETCPREDRTPERRVFPGFSPDVAKNVMARACKSAGIVHRHPHDLRHRYASVQIGRGVPVTQVAAQLGHSRKSLTLDTYSHVLTGD